MRRKNLISFSLVLTRFNEHCPTAVVECFHHIWECKVFSSLHICDCPRKFEKPMNYSPWKGKLLSRLSKKILTRAIKFDKLFDILCLHRGIILDGSSLKTLLLKGSSCLNILEQIRWRLILSFFKKSRNIFSRNFKDHINSIQKGTWNLTLIPFYLSKSTSTLSFWIFIISTFTRIHWSYKHQICWILHTTMSSGDIDYPIF